MPPDWIGLFPLELQQSLRFGCIPILERRCSRGIGKTFAGDIELLGVNQQVAQCIDPARPFQQEGKFPHRLYAFLGDGLRWIVVGKRDADEAGLGVGGAGLAERMPRSDVELLNPVLVAAQIGVETSKRQANSEIFRTRLEHLAKLIGALFILPGPGKRARVLLLERPVDGIEIPGAAQRN